MRRPAKSTKTKSGVITMGETAARLAAEDSLRGAADRIAPAYQLTKGQEAIFWTIVNEYQAAGVLGNLDSYVLTMTAVSIDRVAVIDQEMNGDQQLITDKEHYLARGKYMTDFWRGCNELCLSPQARAKIGVAAAKAAKDGEDKLAKLLADDDD